MVIGKGKKMIEYMVNCKELGKLHMNGFCKDWKKPLDECAIKSIIRNSQYSILAVDKENVVGIITALSDLVNWAFIPYLEVKDDYQGNGIGTALVQKLLNNLSDINCIDLTCDIELQSFYERFNMLKSNGMVIRRYLSVVE